MLLKTEWVERLIQACATVRSARRRSLAAGQPVYSTMPVGRCRVVTAGYVMVLDPRFDGNRFVLYGAGRRSVEGTCDGGVKIATILTSAPRLADITRINYPYGASRGFHAPC
jgi:hypothetical protein